MPTITAIMRECGSRQLRVTLLFASFLFIATIADMQSGICIQHEWQGADVILLRNATYPVHCLPTVTWPLAERSKSTK